MNPARNRKSRIKCTVTVIPICIMRRLMFALSQICFHGQTTTDMSLGSFKVSYKISDLGALRESSAASLSLLDITNYSLEGELEISADDDAMKLVQVPLIEAFHAIRQILKIVPIFTKSAPYAQMFREARTIFAVEGDKIQIKHLEIPPLRGLCGSEDVSGSYVQFCVAFGATAKAFVRDLETIAPSLFEDEKTMGQFADLFVGGKIKDQDPSVYSIV